MGVCPSCGAKLDHILAYKAKIELFIGTLNEEGDLQFDYFCDEETQANIKDEYACPICEAPLELDDETDVKAFLCGR